MTRRLDDTWVDTLDPMHRATLAMVSERLTDTEWFEVRPEGMSRADLATTLRELMRAESIRIPAGTPGVSCRWCQRTIYWLPSRAKLTYRESVSIDGDDCRAPTETAAGEGFAHLVDCPRSGLFIDVAERELTCDPVNVEPETVHV